MWTLTRRVRGLSSPGAGAEGGSLGVPARGAIQGDAEEAAEEGPGERGVLKAVEKST